MTHEYDSVSGRYIRTGRDSRHGGNHLARASDRTTGRAQKTASAHASCNIRPPRCGVGISPPAAESFDRHAARADAIGSLCPIHNVRRYFSEATAPW